MIWSITEFLIAKLSSLCCILIESSSYLPLNSTVNPPATPELFMRELSGAWELASYAMRLHKIFKPALDNQTIRQPGRELQGSKSRTKITTAYTALHNAMAMLFARRNIYWGETWFRMRYYVCFFSVGSAVLQNPKLLPWWILFFLRYRNHWVKSVIWGWQPNLNRQERNLM